MARPNRFQRGAPQPPTRVKRNSQVEISRFQVGIGAANWPTVSYEPVAVCPSKQAISIMGLKLTWFVEFVNNQTSTPTRIFGNLGLIRLSDAEVTAYDPADNSGRHNGFQEVDQRLARRVFGKQTTVVAVESKQSSTTSGPTFAAMVQAKNKGIITLTAGQGLYVAGFLDGDAATTRSINCMCEWSQTARTSEAFSP